MMKESVESLKGMIDFADYAHFSLWTFGLIGLVITAIVQSSSAVGVMSFSALASGLISFPATIAILMGANL